MLKHEQLRTSRSAMNSAPPPGFDELCDLAWNPRTLSEGATNHPDPIVLAQSSDCCPGFSLLLSPEDYDRQQILSVVLSEDLPRHSELIDTFSCWEQVADFFLTWMFTPLAGHRADLHSDIADG
jgi:hypothetical protein